MDSARLNRPGVIGGSTISNKAVQKTQTAQITKVPREPQLAIAIEDNAIKSLDVLEISKQLMEGYDNTDAKNQIGIQFLQMPTEFLRTPAQRITFNLEAFKFFSLAACDGSAMGQNNVGYMYEKGLGVEKNIAAAMEWYERAAGKDLEVAKLNVQRLKLHLNVHGTSNTVVKDNVELMRNNQRRAELENKKPLAASRTQNENQHLKELNKNAVNVPSRSSVLTRSLK